MILALKTAGTTTQAWIISPSDADPAADFEWESGRELSTGLLGRLMEFLRSHHLELSSLTGVIIFSGPGSFTSLRIGHATANALADSLNIPIVGATGEDWLATGQEALKSALPRKPAMPHYGAGANITKPKS